MRRWTSIIAGTIAGAIVALAASQVVAQDVSAKITSPKAGDPLFGLVSIRGTASNANMQRYTLEWDSQDTATDTWLLIAGPISQQVKDGVLAQWNTTNVPDGRYQIRLRVILRDGTVLSDIVQNLRVTNKQPTALPTILPSATTLPPTLPPTAGPSPTPLIQQPPTSTPRPAVVAPPPTTGPTDVPEEPQLVVAFTSVQNAFCAGVYLAIIGFAILIGYSVINMRVRPALRRMRRESYRD